MKIEQSIDNYFNTTLSQYKHRIAITVLISVTGTQIAHAGDAADNTFYRERKSFGTSLETEPPRYVKQLNKTRLKNYDGLENVDWLDIGLDYRLRYEFRNNDFRRSKDVIDEPVLLRTRAYVGVKDILDPLRLTLEIEDARRNHSQFTREFDTRDINYSEPIQAYAELYFKEAPLGQDGLGNSRPISIKAGRMAFEKVDKRLLARNNYRNTTNNFHGVRITFGQQKNDWQVDIFAFNPIQRFTNQPDERNESQRFYGVVTDWRRWSDVVSLQPYYYLLKQDGGKVKYDLNGREEASVTRKIDRTIHTAGLRAYGQFDKTNWDYDVNYVQQWGQQDTSLTNKAKIKHEAYAYNAEVGYTFEHAWKPRLSAFYALVTGDNNPTDKQSQRFERLFGFARPWSNTDTFEMSNIRTPKLRLEFEPKIAFINNLKIDTGYSWYRLESDTDTWGPAGLRDRSGKSGNNVGEEFDITARFRVNQFVSTSIGYSHFWAGDFTKRAKRLASNANDTTRGDESDYFYVEVSVSAF